VARSLPSTYADGGRLKAAPGETTFSLPLMSVDEAGVGGRCEEAIGAIKKKAMGNPDGATKQKNSS
jgi:hypothetical protein